MIQVLAQVLEWRCSWDEVLVEEEGHVGLAGVPNSLGGGGMYYYYYLSLVRRSQERVGVEWQEIAL